MNILYTTHNAGFYSCCSIRLYDIINFYNKNKKFPDKVDSSQQFQQYKNNSTWNKDITFCFFEQENKEITEKNMELIPFPVRLNPHDTEDQFSNYKLLNFEYIKPIIQKYFSISVPVKERLKYFESTYSIDYENTCAVFYRGNDKVTEVNQPTYQEMINKAKELHELYPSITFLVQTDVTEFVTEFKNNFNNIIHLKEIPTISSNNRTSIQYCINQEQRIDAVLLYNAAIQIISKCKYIICTSGNGEIWSMMYRGHTNGVYQYLKPLKYDTTQTNFWV